MLAMATSVKNPRYTSTVNWKRFMSSNQFSGSQETCSVYSFDATWFVALLILHGEIPFFASVASRSADRVTAHSLPKFTEASTSLFCPGVTW